MEGHKILQMMRRKKRDCIDYLARYPFGTDIKIRAHELSLHSQSLDCNAGLLGSLFGMTAGVPAERGSRSLNQSQACSCAPLLG